MMSPQAPESLRSSTESAISAPEAVLTELVRHLMPTGGTGNAVADARAVLAALQQVSAPGPASRPQMRELPSPALMRLAVAGNAAAKTARATANRSEGLYEDQIEQLLTVADGWEAATRAYRTAPLAARDPKSPLRARVKSTLLAHRMAVHCDEQGDPAALVDFLGLRGSRTGVARDEIERLTDAVCVALGAEGRP